MTLGFGHSNVTTAEDDRNLGPIELVTTAPERPFRIDNLWEPAFFSLQQVPPLEKFGWDDDLPNLARGIFRSQHDLFTGDGSLLYNLNIFGTETSESADTSTGSTNAHDPSQAHQEEEEDVSDDAIDVWGIPSLLNSQGRGAIIRSWDTFPNHPVSQWQPLSLSEAGRRGFDAALVHQASLSGLEDSGRVAQTEPFLWSLFKLGLGWNSVFFRYNEQTRKFEKDIKDVRISGISLAALDSLIQEFLECGTHIRTIRQFLATIPSKEAAAPSVNNLRRAIFVLIYGVEDQMFEQFKKGLSLLELQESFRRCECLMRCLLDLVSCATNATSDGEVISNVFKTCDHYSQKFMWLSEILHEIMTFVAKPWLALVATWIGLTPWTFEAAVFNLFDLNGPGDMPDIVPLEHVEAIFESGRILRLLRKAYPNHPLVKRGEGLTKLSSLPLEFAITWQDIDQIQLKAQAYEAQVRAEILKYRPTEPARVRVNEITIAESRQNHGSVDNIFELSDLDTLGLLSDDSLQSEKLRELLAERQCLNPNKNLGIETAFGPRLGLSVYLSFSPVMSAQARLINFSYLQVLFKYHKVRDHLELQWRFQLLGDSSFISRLSLSLFDPEMKSGERRKGVARDGLSTGLRLGSRDTWPPATSELRLVLMGMLTECYSTGRTTVDKVEGQRSAMEEELPGGLSFAIRELTDEEIIKCKNPNAIEALDFLRLQYNPPPFLDEVITAKSLRRYDRLFKHLLRLTRMKFVVQSLIRQITGRQSCSYFGQSNIERRFRFEAMHFIQALSDYSFNICIADTWRKFERTLIKIERCIEKGDIAGTLTHAESPARLRKYHEDVLEEMLSALFLSKKHVQVNTQLELIFGTILAYASLSKQEKPADLHYERSVYQLYFDFRKRAGEFVRFLRGLDGGRLTMSGSRHRELASLDSGQDHNTEVNGIFEHLLLRLDLKEYY
ncbi:hypothetical protein VTO42DRAFT_8452 [Malbranchea cinnamomea]